MQKSNLILFLFSSKLVSFKNVKIDDLKVK